MKNKVKAAYSLLDLNDPDLFSNLQEANSDPEESATITAVTKEGVETSCADGSVSLAMMIFDTNSIAGHLQDFTCLLYTSPSPRDRQKSRMPSSA